MGLPSSGFRGIAPRRALLCLALAAGAAAILSLIALGSHAPPSAPSAGEGDLALYARVVARLASGGDYYASLRDELATAGYGLKSVFNWRTPLLLTLVGWLNSPVLAQAAMAVLAGVAGLFALRLVAREAGWRTARLALVPLAFSLAMAAAPQSYLFGELVAGPLILLSVSAYGLGQKRLGFGAAVLALFVRELAAPYVLVCIGVAAWQRRWREVGAWALVLAAYGGYFAVHAWQVSRHTLPSDYGDPEGWLQWGGAAFGLATASFNGLFTLLPPLATALLLPFGILGLAGWTSPAGRRALATVAVYLVVFAAVGKPYNMYWGALYTPILTLGWVWVVPALRDLWAALDRPRAGLSPA